MKRLSKYIIVFCFLSNLLFGQNSEFIQGFNEYCESCKLDNWSVQKYGEKKRPIKKVKPKDNYQINKTKSGETFFEITHSGTSIEFHANYLRDIEDKKLHVSFDVMYTDIRAIQAVNFIHSVGSAELEVYRFTRSTIDSMKIKEWNRVDFFFTPLIFKGMKNQFLIRYHNPYFGSGRLSLKNFHIYEQKVLESNNLVRNSSFESYYYFPVGMNRLFAGSMEYWNDFKTEYDLIDSNLMITWGSNSFIFTNSTIASNYTSTNNGNIEIYDGHFAAQIPNEYVYDYQLVPKDELRNASYLQIKLSKPLIEGESYDLSFAIMLAPQSRVADNSFGVKICKGLYNPLDEVNLYSVDRPLPSADILFFLEPIQNDSTWTVLTVRYTAKGDEDHLCFGVFQNTEHIQRSVIKNVKSNRNVLGGYLIDEVILRPSTQSSLTKD